METNEPAGTEQPLTQDLASELDRAITAAAERDGIHLDEPETPESDALNQEQGEGSNDATASNSADDNASATETTEASKPGAQASQKEKGTSASAEQEPTDSVTKANEAAEDEEKLSPYARRQRKLEQERKRLSESWKQLEAEKAEVRRLREEQERKLAEAQPTQRSQHSAEDYEAFARKAESEGEYEMADTARAEAARLRAEAQTAQPTEDRRALEQAQAAEYQKAKAEIPELQDPKSPLATQVVDMLRRTPDLLKYPNGPALAARYVAAQARAARVPELEATVAKLTAKINELEALTSVGGGTPGGVTSEPDFSAMSLEDQERWLKREIARR